ncbi:hypothetical protein P3389_19000, partial [Vibrio parahaemolyticus]|nr:hypothetical protein [Vibrio parahaemolyticus]
ELEELMLPIRKQYGALTKRRDRAGAAVLIRSAAPKLSRCASPATASTRPPSWPGTVRPR